MKNLRPELLLLCLFLFLGFQAFPRQDSTVHINTIVERSQLVFKNYPIEKVHLHFDKPYYAVGDTVWFKGYLTTNLFEFLPSQVMYVEVLTASDSLVQILKLPLVNNTTKGQLVLDQKWFSKNNYRFRAYTNWMANFDPDYFFNKIIPVGDVLNNLLHTSISFTDLSDGRNNRVQTNLQFSDRSGKVMGNQRVNWELVSNFEVLEKGRAETDAMGNLVLNLQAKDRVKFSEAKLNVSMPDPLNSNELLVGNFAMKSALWDVDVQFFPEGGDLIAGMDKRVAFKILGSNGLGVSAVGQVLDQAGAVVADFKDLHAGMGIFQFIPREGEQYKARLTFENGQNRTFDLPEVKTEGISLVVVNDDAERIQLGIMANSNFLKRHENQVFSVMAQSEGALSYAAQVTLKNELLTIDLPKERFATGIAQLVLFSPQGMPISERLIFIESLKPLEIQIKTDKEIYSTKGLVRLDLSTLDNDTTFVGNYSISVVDEQKVPYEEDREITILSNFLLTSQLKGYVEKPNYYFNPAHANRREAVDALLMTQGYKRFSYVDIIAQKYPEMLFFPETGIELSGTLRYTNGRPVENGGLLLSIPDRSFRTDTYTDAQGRFKFSNLVFTDSARVTINARGNDNYRNMVIHMDQSFFPAVDRNELLADGELNINLLMQPYLDNSRNVFRTDILIEEVEVTVKPTRSHREFPAISGLSTADHQIGTERLKGCNNLFFCLQTILTGINYDPTTQLFYITRDFNAGGRIPVQFFINGMAVDIASLNSIMPNEVEGIDIFLKDELGTVSRSFQNNGVVSIYTTKKAEVAPRMSLSEIERLLPKANVVDLNPLGYLKQYTFYTPKYETQEQQAVNDIRSTVYWNPEVVTDEQGKASVSYYNADGRGTYRVVVEGMNAAGNFGRAVYRYRVN